MAEYDIIMARVHDVQRRWSKTRLWTAVWSGLLGLTALLLCASLLDVLFPLPFSARLALWLVAAVDVVVGLVYLVIRRKHRRISDEGAAQLVEKHYPHLQDHLVSAVELGAEQRLKAASSQPTPGETPAVTDYLVNRLLKETRSRSTGLDVRAAVSRVRLRRLTVACLGIAAAVALLAGAYPDTVGLVLTRILTPWRASPPVQWTRIQLSPGHAVLKQGSDQPISASLAGHSVEEALLHLRRAGEVWRQLPMVPAGEDSFTYELYDLQTDLDYRVTAGDGRTETYHIAVYAPPELLRTSVAYDYPAYTGLPATLRESGDIRAVVGTRVKISAHFSKPLTAASLEMSGDTLRADRLSGLVASFGFELVDSSSYTIQVTDVEGYDNGPGERFSIFALPDRPPAVTIPEPGGDVWTTASDIVPVSVMADDDFGLRELVFNSSINGAPAQTVVMGRFDSPGARMASGSHTFELRGLRMLPGDVISYYAEAEDNLPSPAGQRSISDLYLIAVRPFQEPLDGFAGAAQGSAQLLSARQAALIRDTWRLVRKERVQPPEQRQAKADSLAVVQGELRYDLERFLSALATLARSLNGLEPLSDADGEIASSAMAAAEGELSVVRPRLAIPPQQEALAALIRLELELPKLIGGGGGGGSGGGSSSDAGGFEAPPASSVQVEEIAREFEEQENLRRQTLFRRARDLLTRTKKAHASQIALNSGWNALGRRESEDGESARFGATQRSLRLEVDRLSQDIAVLERVVETDRVASTAAAAAAGHMREIVDLAFGASFQRAAARGTKARMQLEHTIDSLFPLMARHAGELLPLLAAALENLAERQEGLVTLAERLGAPDQTGDADQVSERQQQLADATESQALLAESARRLRLRLGAAADELLPLSDTLAVVANRASQAMADSLIEDLMIRAARLLRRQDPGSAVADQRRAARSLRTIAASLAGVGAAGPESELALAARALEAARAARSAAEGEGEGGDGGGGGGKAIDELQAAVEPLDDVELDAALGGIIEARSALAGGGGGDGDTSAEARGPVLAALDRMVGLLEARIRRLEQQMQLAKAQQDGYPPEYRDLVRQYYKVLAEAGEINR